MTFSLPHELLMRKAYEKGLEAGKIEERTAIVEFIETRYPLLNWLAQEIKHDDLG